ncbi:FBD-associated F-box protein At5g60610-like [Camellia sinensis]|uniref:FBD-associated F-box protein At5g60610-like n=1 Tax=Camellia sinensis TaxID=4442 RepID=UPI001035B511|nr:FBD-associated F-box protein At5g60610-like [Camellia sinensis]
MLGKISNVQHLELSNGIPKVVTEAFDYNTLLFHNLTHLRLQICDIHWSILLDLLGHMPNLKVLVFNKNKGHKNLELCLWSGEPESVPKCLSLCVEAIEFSGFAGCKGEMKLVSEIFTLVFSIHLPVALTMDQSSKLSDSKEKDRISNLPDEILSHILCFMPTKYAARTSLLSTRWKSVWTSVHIIDLDSFSERGHNEQSSGFIDFVDRLLLLRNSPNLNKFRLQCRFGYYNPYRLNS